ncbi:hypothetical protein DRH14_04430 [Candidatus Shapirobacteria bacterium]|nr:MAG: hypothetical protein DRH14_04430 [Candidatus Shapirobacteria bacterium]
MEIYMLWGKKKNEKPEALEMVSSKKHLEYLEEKKEEWREEDYNDFRTITAKMDSEKIEQAFAPISCEIII